MPDVPRDPRQLARDILSGKIKIEDLARERQARPPVAGPSRVPDNIPLARSGPPPARPLPPRPAPPQRQQQFPPQRPPQPSRPFPVPPPATRTPQRPPGYSTAVPPPASRQPERSATPAPAPTPPLTAPRIAAAPRKPVSQSVRVRDLVKSKTSLRQGILLAEILNKPVALRDERSFS